MHYAADWFLGLETQQEYSEQGQLLKIIQPNGGVIRLAYNEQGQVTETKDPEGGLWLQEYEAKGNMIKQTDPLGHTTKYKYNVSINIIEKLRTPYLKKITQRLNKISNGTNRNCRVYCEIFCWYFYC